MPLADPYLLPMAALLTAIGLTEIYRLGPSERVPAGALGRDRRRRVRRDALRAAPRLPRAREVQVPLRPRARSRCSSCRCCPGIGETINGSRLWVHVGPLQFQPGELGKIALIVFLAAYLREKREVLAQGRLKDWGPLLVIWGGAMLVLFATDDLGSALLYYGIFLAMLYVATARLSFVAAALGLFLVGAFAVYAATPHVRERVTTGCIRGRREGLLRARPAPRAPAGLPSYQVVQSLYSIAHGGFGGTGLGRGIVHARTTGQQIVPDLNTDFIYSALAQELGLIGAAALLLALHGLRRCAASGSRCPRATASRSCSPPA